MTDIQKLIEKVKAFIKEKESIKGSPLTDEDFIDMDVETFGTEYQDKRFIEQYVRDSYDLTPKGIIDSLGLLDVDYNRVSAYGHFGKADLPWEK